MIEVNERDLKGVIIIEYEVRPFCLFAPKGALHLEQHKVKRSKLSNVHIFASFGRSELKLLALTYDEEYSPRTGSGRVYDLGGGGLKPQIR